MKEKNRETHNTCFSSSPLSSLISPLESVWLPFYFYVIWMVGVYLSVCFLSRQVSRMPGGPQTHYVGKLLMLPILPKCWNYRYGQPYLGFFFFLQPGWYFRYELSISQAIIWIHHQILLSLDFRQTPKPTECFLLVVFCFLFICLEGCFRFREHHTEREGVKDKAKKKDHSERQHHWGCFLLSNPLNYPQNLI